MKVPGWVIIGGAGVAAYFLFLRPRTTGLTAAQIAAAKNQQGVATNVWGALGQAFGQGGFASQIWQGGQAYPSSSDSSGSYVETIDTVVTDPYDAGDVGDAGGDSYWW